MAALVARLRAAGCVYAEDEAALLSDAGLPADALERAVARRVAGEPLEQVLGWAAFGGLRVLVEPGVFVPRRRTELLAREAVALALPGSVVVDLCCGSGAVGAMVLAAVPDAELHAVDVDPVATRCARRNLPAGATVGTGDLFDPLPSRLRGRVDVVVVNAPYVPTAAIATMPPEARDHEPRASLDGGADGVEVHRRVASGAPTWLAPGGHLLVETSTAQAASTAAAAADAGLTTRVVRDDDLDATVVLARRPVAG